MKPWTASSRRLSRLLNTTARDAAAKTTVEEPSSLDDFDSILESFDSMTAARDQDFSREARSEIEGLGRQRIKASSSAHEPSAVRGMLSDVQIRRRRDHTNSSFDTIGSHIQPGYSPRQLLNNPPEMANTGLPALIAAQAHLGHSTALWNPLTQPFIYGIRNGVHIFNLDLTLSHLRRAAEVIKGIAMNDGNILFVGTRPGQKRSVVEAARRSGGYHVFERWIPGTITNGKQVVGHGIVKHLITKHRRNSTPTSNPSSAPNSIVPDLVVVLNPLENRNLLQECARGRVPTIGIIDSDVDPRLVTYSIPANDDSIRCTSLIVGLLSRAAEAGRAQRTVSEWEQVEID